MAKYIIVATVALMVLIVGAASSIPSNDDFDRAFVQGKMDLCKSSKCAECGTFFYYTYPDTRIGYTPSYCESTYEAKLREAERVRQDLEIRNKYGR